MHSNERKILPHLAIFIYQHSRFDPILFVILSIVIARIEVWSS